MALGTILGIGSAVAGAVGNIAAADAQAAGQRAMVAAQNKATEKSINNTNKYNKKVYRKQKRFIEDQRNYNFDTAMINWQYNKDIQDYNYAAELRAYKKDQQNLRNQLEMNDLAAKQGYLAEQRVMKEMAMSQSFARQDSYIENLQKAGRARLGAAGQSSQRAIQMTAAEHGRNLAVLDASFTSAIEQHNINMFDIALARFGADYNAQANAMLKPQPLPEIPQPTMPPLPKFKKPKKLKFFELKSYADSTGAILGGIGGVLGSVGGALGGLAGSKPTAVPGGGDG